MNGELDTRNNTDIDVSAVLPEESHLSANAEYVVLTEPVTDGEVLTDTPLKKTGIFKSICRIVAVILAVAGTVSYGFLGFCGIWYLKNGGFSEMVASQIFGGVVVKVEPQAVPKDEVSLPLDNEAELEIPTVEYLQISSENIGCADPNTVFNETDYDLDSKSVEASAAPAYKSGDTVLIIHTHGTESYAPEGDVPVDEDFRTDDPDNNVIAVGSAFAEILESKGINVIHCTEMFDEQSYIDAYSRSGEAVAEYMENYPDIAYVIDIHRDAVIRQSGAVIRSEGGSGAQLMIVCGTDEMGANFPDWRENFAFGKEYQHRLYDRDPTIVRHMNLRAASFNQQLCEKYLLLEVGTCGNTLAEAISAARTAAEVFGEMLLGE